MMVLTEDNQTGKGYMLSFAEHNQTWKGYMLGLAEHTTKQGKATCWA